MARRGAKYLDLYFNSGELSNTLIVEKYDEFTIHGFTSSLYKMAMAGWNLAIKQDSRWSNTIKYTFHHSKHDSFGIKVIDTLEHRGLSDEALKDILLEHLLKCLNNHWSYKNIEKTSWRMGVSETTFKKVERKITIDASRSIMDFSNEDFENEADRRGYIIWDRAKNEAHREAEMIAIGASSVDKRMLVESMEDEELLAEMVRRIDAKPKTKKKLIKKTEPVEPLPSVSTNVIDFSEILEMTRRNEPIYTEISDEEIA